LVVTIKSGRGEAAPACVVDIVDDAESVGGLS